MILTTLNSLQWVALASIAAVLVPVISVIVVQRIKELKK